MVVFTHVSLSLLSPQVTVFGGRPNLPPKVASTLGIPGPSRSLRETEEYSTTDHFKVCQMQTMPVLLDDWSGAV